jgi:hypothetical protein
MHCGIKCFIFIPRPLDISHQNLIGWKLAAPNALNSQALAYDVRLLAGSHNQWMYTTSSKVQVSWSGRESFCANSIWNPVAAGM